MQILAVMGPHPGRYRQVEALVLGLPSYLTEQPL